MNQEESPNRNTELLYRLDEKVVEVLRRMGEQDKEITEFRSSTNTVHVQFNQRLQALENFRWWFLGVAAVVGLIASILKDYILRSFK